MNYTFSYNDQLSIEFANFPHDQQTAILQFAVCFSQHGLSDFTKYPGKITQSWSCLDVSDPAYSYTYGNDLWHYHVGLPSYKSVHPKYKTSDIVLHFQWPDWQKHGTHIDLVDIYNHYTSKGDFYLPPASYLAKSSR